MPNHKREEPVIRVTVGLDQSDHHRLSHLAKKSGVSLAWVVRRAAGEFLSRHDDDEELATPAVKRVDSTKEKRGKKNDGSN